MKATKLLLVMLLAASVVGCAGLETAASVVSATKSVVCTNTTEEWRTEVRGKQNVKTNACQDRISK